MKGKFRWEAFLSCFDNIYYWFVFDEIWSFYGFLGLWNLGFFGLEESFGMVCGRILEDRDWGGEVLGNNTF